MDESFYFCQNLKQIEIPPNSELISIGKKAFYNTSIKKITFPPNLTLIGQSAFLHCKKLKEIEFLTNHEVLTIESNAFNSSPIETILTPENTQLKILGDDAFHNSSINYFHVPDSFKKIKQFNLMLVFTIYQI